MADALADRQYQQALAALDSPGATVEDKVSMLVEIAMGLQHRPKGPAQLRDAVALYDRALALCPDEDALVAARIRARKATALQAVPETSGTCLQQARAELEQALAVLETEGLPEERAEAQMNLGLTIQSLAGLNQARITDAIGCYQQALRTFTRQAHPAEFAILHNNLATAFLALPVSDGRAKMREALAVQSFEAALGVVSLVDQPSEYAMLQNNLGNALQYASSAHPVENNLRALQAYDEALKVRNRRDTPVAYANTISNKANCLRNLPDDPNHPQRGNRVRLREALSLYQEAQQLFHQFGESDKVQLVQELLDEVRSMLGNGAGGEPQFGESPV
ncbi:MAG: hypothetical protein P8076_08485 [Gammaproteobacteria bacterium]